jgi:hypothetical protein
MNRFLRAAAGLLVWAVACLPAPLAGQAQGLPSIRRVQVLGNRNQIEIEIEASSRIVPQTNVLTGPDRLVVDFVNAVPGAQLRNQSVNRGAVKSLRVGLFTSNPPVTRVVLDLNGPQPYQVFPAGRTVIVKVGGSTGAQVGGYRPASGPVLVNTSYPTAAAHLSVPVPSPQRTALEVSFQDGLLSIVSNKASLSEVLFAVHQRTGAEIAIPAGAEQELVAAELGPAPAPEVLAQLLNGSRFNFLILSSSIDPRALDRVILSPRAEGPMSAQRPLVQPVTDDDDAAEVQSRVAAPARPAPPTANPNPAADGQVQPGPPETKPNSDVPD